MDRRKGEREQSDHKEARPRRRSTTAPGACAAWCRSRSSPVSTSALRWRWLIFGGMRWWG